MNCREHKEIILICAHAQIASNPDLLYKKNTFWKTEGIFNIYNISGKQDLNLRPQRPERRALPAALLPVIYNNNFNSRNWGRKMRANVPNW